MRIDAIRIQNFRRIKDAVVDFEKDLTIFVGPNNSGKTSATQALSLFLDGKVGRFSLYDFNSESWNDLSRLEKKDESLDLSFPTISLDLWFSVEEADLHRVIDLLPNLDWEGTQVGIRVELAPSDPIGLLTNYHESKEAAEANAKQSEDSLLVYHPWPKTLRDYLERELKNEYELQYFIIDRAEFDDEYRQQGERGVAEIVTDKDRSGHTVLRSLLRIDFLSAQRHLDDGEGSASRAEDLSRRLSSFYKRNLRKREDDHEALRALSASEEELTRHFADVFEDTFEQVGKLGYPGLLNPKLEIRAALRMERLMGDQQAKVHYILREEDEETEAVRLPDNYNGLGFKNLIYMGVDLLDAHASWVEEGEDCQDKRAPLHLIFIEEPEAHMHAQLQQAFVRKLTELLGPLHDGVFRTQFVITTHSAHVLFERGFVPIRYFRREVEKGEAQSTTVHNLSQFCAVNEPDKHFLERYMKLTHCDLFFADAAVLVEGNVERLLLPHIIDRDVNALTSAYLSILEVGGAYAHRFRKLVEFLGKTTLIITDLDSVHPRLPENGDEEEGAGTSGESEEQIEDADQIDAVDDEEKKKRIVPTGKCQSDVPDAITSNQTLIKWLPKKKTVHELLKAEDAECIQSQGALVRVAYQRRQVVTWKDATKLIAGRTFEEAFAFTNLAWIHDGDQKGMILRIRGAAQLDLEQLIERVHEKVKGDNFKKTDFALVLLAEKPDGWTTPAYITEGLDWLAQKIVPVGSPSSEPRKKGEAAGALSAASGNEAA